MSRLHLTFNCEGETLAATLDTAPSSTGLLLVSGGNEIRSGAFGGQARLARTIARAGFPVFRYDRRGIGDSGGENTGYAGSEPDIRAAVEAFQAVAPSVTRVVGFGNCDAASALMLAEGAGCNALVLSNPWTIENETDSTPPPAAVRARYAEKLKNPRELARLLTGRVNISKLVKGLRTASKKNAAPSALAHRMQARLAAFNGDAHILLAGADRTAQVFADVWDVDDARIQRCEGASHAYAEDHARAWLEKAILKALRA